MVDLHFGANLWHAPSQLDIIFSNGFYSWSGFRLHNQFNSEEEI